MGFIEAIYNNLAFIRKRGKTKIVYLPWTTSNEIADGSLVVWSSGRLIPATSSTGGLLTAGVARKTITSASTEYTTNSDIPVEMPVEKNVEWEFLGASLSTSTVGTYLDISNAYTVNGAASTYDIVFQTKYISSTKGIGILNIGPESLGVQ